MEILGIVILVAVIILAIIALFTVKWALNLRVVVPTNMVHIVQNKLGATSYGRNSKDSGNVYYAWPSWIPVVGLTVIKLPESNFTIDLKDYEAYDSARLPFVVDVAAFFRIDQSNLAAQRVTSVEDLRSQLKQIIQGAVRRILATNTLEEIMEARSSLGSQFTEEVLAQLKEWGVTTVKTIEFMDLRDAPGSNVIANIMRKEQSRIDRESRVAIAANQQTAETAEIEKSRAIALSKQDMDREVGMRSATTQQDIGIEQQKAEQRIAAEAKNTAEANMAVESVNAVKKAEINKATAVIVAAQNKEVATVNAEAEKSVRVTNATAEKEAATLRADGELQATLKNAEGITAKGTAEAAAQKASLMAPVEAQIALAEKIGSDEGYQTYLISIEQVAANKEVGIAMAAAMGHAKMTVVANGSDIKGGVNNLMDMFSGKGGSAIGSMVTALGGTTEGKALLDNVMSRIGGNTDKAAA
jgi:flotillin